jgi:hypothetical protein
MTRHKPSATLLEAHDKVMARLARGDASPDLQLAFGRCYRSEAGRIVLDWIVRELNVRLFTGLDDPWDRAIGQAHRLIFSDQLEDLIRRGLQACEAEAEGEDG